MQNHSIRLTDALAVFRKILLAETERGQWQRRFRLVENTHDDAFSMIERSRRYAQIEIQAFFRVLLEHDASVLRQSPLGDIEVAHDLQPRDERRSNPRRQT
jgi:hypothetical protein